MAQLNFKGKQFVQNHHLSVPFHELIPQKDKSKTDKLSLHDNLIIHGDNLLALKALLPTYAGKVKCIYIDPPYNTGNEKWKYNDNVNSPMMQEWLKSNTPVDKEDLTRHDKWLCMMTPRLKLLKELLRDDGVIFVSIDDNEVHHLRMLMDEIFGEENFISNIIWTSRKSVSNDAIISLSHNHTLVFCKSLLEFEKIKSSFKLKLDKTKFSNLDNDSRGDWIADPFDAPNIRPNLTYKIVNPKTKVVYMPPADRCWRTNETEYKKLLDDKRIIFGKTGNSKPQLKRFWEEVKDMGATPKSIWDDCGTTTEGTKELEKIFGKKIFNNPKPSRFIKKIISLSTYNKDIILDSFAGSGTTAHAVLNLNKEDSGNRKFILVEMEDYADNITAERVRRVIKGYSDKEGTGGTFSYFDLGKPIEIESLLSGKNLPTYSDLARYVFYTATGEEFDDSKVDEENNFIGENKDYEIYLFYKPDLEYLKNTALTLDRAKELENRTSKRKLVFAPTKYLDQEHLDEFKIDFAQLPFEIYKLAK